MLRFEWSRRKKQIAIGAAAVAVALTGSAFAFGPVVRGKVDKAAAKRGVVVTIGHVHAGWFRATLEDVTVVPEGTAGVRAHVDTVEVELSAGMSVERVHATGARVELEDDALAEVAAWRTRHPSQGDANAPKTPISVEQAAISWKHAFADGDANIDGTGMTITRDDKGLRVTSESVSLTRKNASVTLGAASASFEDGKLHEAHVDSARVALVLDAVKPAAPPAPEPLPVVHKQPHGKPPPEPFHPIAELPDLHLLRAMIQNAAKQAGDRLPEGLHVGLDQLTVELTRGAEKLELGPGKVTLERKENDIAVDFSAGSEQTQTPLTLGASIPLGAGDTVISLAGGPVTLSILGVREGSFGFADPGRATVRGKARLALDDAAKTLTFDGDIAASSVSIKDTRLADETVRGLDVRVSARGVVDDAGRVRLDDAEAQLGALHLHTRGQLEQTSDHLSASLSFELPVAGCQSLLESVPAALLPHVSRARFRGTLGAKGFLSFDTRKIEDLVLKYDIDDLCRVTAVPEELKKDHFDGSFSYAIVDKDGKPADRASGPGSDDWAPLDTISPMMQVAVLTTEDGAFFHHHGFNTWAIRSSLVANIKSGRFIRGASTITMQLAKNLFLSREKTFSRKLEELILTDYLEHAFGKEEMMELYLNIIEFGPDIYGVRAAAQHYFGRRPAELNLAESLFLSSLLPRPREYHKMYEKGEVPASWMNNIHALMEVARKNARISDQELEEAKTETIAFHREDASPVVPRRAVRGSHFTGDERTDDGWETN